MIAALPAVELPKNAVLLIGLLMKVPPPAVDVSKKSVLLKALVNVVRLPAVALLMKSICAALPVTISPTATKFCVIPELFVMPTPLIVNPALPVLSMGVVAIVNALAPALKTMPLASVLAERERPVMLEDTNV